MLKDRKALLEQEMKDVHKLAAQQYFDIALFAKNYKDEEFDAERIAYETTLHKYNNLKAEMSIINEMIEQGNP
jgi:hypothetical protein